ncbi:hypothetical protein ACFL1Q_00020 [Patescibacteria group bacterium]
MNCEILSDECSTNEDGCSYCPNAKVVLEEITKEQLRLSGIVSSFQTKRLINDDGTKEIATFWSGIPIARICDGVLDIFD